MSATLDLPALTVETPVAHLGSPRTPVKATSRRSQDTQAQNIKPVRPTFSFALKPRNGGNISYSALRAREHQLAPELVSSLQDPGCFHDGPVLSSSGMAKLLIHDGDAEAMEYSTLLEPLGEQNPGLAAKVCSPVMCSPVMCSPVMCSPVMCSPVMCSPDILKNDCLPSAVSSSLLIQHLTKSSAITHVPTKNGNACSPVSKGDNRASNSLHDHENILSAVVDDDDVEWSDKDDDEIECGECNKIFCNIQSYMDHTCCRLPEPPKTTVRDDVPQVHPAVDRLTDGFSPNDAVRFLGKIIFTPSGSAYVIEDTSIDSTTLTQLGNSLIHAGGGSDEVADSHVPQLSSVIFFPQMNSSLMISSSNQNTPHQLERSGFNKPFYSYHVCDIGTVGTTDVLQSLLAAQGRQQVPQPVVMCFICRQIFHKTESLLRHATCSHSVDVTEETRSLLVRLNHSIVCHVEGSDKRSQLSVLCPMDGSCVGPHARHSSSVSCRRKLADFVTNRRSSDCERRLSFGDNKGHSFTLADNISGALDDSKLQVNLTPVGGWKSELSSANTSPPSFAAQHKTTRENFPRMSSPAPSVMAGWYLLPSAVTENLTSADSCATLDINTSPTVTQTTLTCCVSPLPVMRSPVIASSICSLALPSVSPSQSASICPLVLPSVSPSQSASICSLALPSVSSSQSATVNNQIDDPFSTKTAFSTSSCPHLSDFSCTYEQTAQERIDAEEDSLYAMALDSAPYLGHNSALTHTRNSCKTLKCPKCNWHYKYQETLDIHMKEKHPDNDALCVYCLNNQSHPRLTRGESYACGYKPYRCEVCNYSTTTKGNLSIHMQSDKHMNNMQDLVSSGSGCQPPSQQPHTNHPPSVTATVSLHNSIMSSSTNQTQPKSLKLRQSFRCDICNYETSLCRNLRIHMTSEKHTHNLFVLSQGISNLSQDANLSQMNNLLAISNHEQPGQLSAFRHLPNPLFYNSSSKLIESASSSGCSHLSHQTLTCPTQKNGLDPRKRTSSKKDADAMFQCCICNKYGSDRLEDVHNHILLERNTVDSFDYHMSFTDGDYSCSLCSYKTHLKANFHLHCKTDKHLHKLQTLNHILEGGPGNEWKLSCPDFPWQICCNPCGFYANSTHNMQLHISSAEHVARGNIFRQLQVLELAAVEPAVGNIHYYHCALCTVSVPTKQQLIAHSRTPQHQGQKEPGISPQAPNVDVYLLKELPLAEDADFLLEDDENNVTCPAINNTPSLVGNSSSTTTTTTTTNITARPATSSTPTTCSTPADSTSTLCCSTEKTTAMEDILTPLAGSRDAELAVQNGARYETAMKTVDGSMSSSLTSVSTSSSMKAEIPTPVTSSYNSLTSSSESRTRCCSSVGFPDCLCSHHPTSRETPTLPGEDGANTECLRCPLCRRSCQSANVFEEHLVKEHKVTKEGMQRLLSMVIIPTSITSSRSPVSAKAAAISLCDDSDEASLSSALSLLTCQPVAPTSELAAPIEPPLPASQIIPSSGDGNRGIYPSHPHPQSTTDHTTHSDVTGIQDKSSEASLHPTSSPRPSSTLSPHATPCPAPGITSSLAPSLATTSDAALSRSGLDQHQEIDLQLVESQHLSLLATEGVDLALQEKLDREFEDLFNCQTCGKPFSDIDRLYHHQNELGHLELKQTPQGPGYLCWKKGCNQYFKTALTLQVHFREIHANRSSAGILPAQEVELYKFTCTDCSFGFKSLEALKTHSLVHLIQSVTQCGICSTRFSCQSSMRRHLETGHVDLSIADIHFQVEKLNKNMQMLFTSPIFEEFTSNVLRTNGSSKSKVFDLMNAEKRDKQDMISDCDVKICESYMDTSEAVLEKCREEQFVQESVNNQSLALNQHESKDGRLKKHPGMLGCANQNGMLAHIKTSLHECGDREEIAKVGPYKCDVCKEWFQQENDFLQHCNSTGHQIQLKQQTAVIGDNPHLISSTASAIAPPQSIRVGSPCGAVNGNGNSESILDGLSTNVKSYTCNVCLICFTNQSGFETHLRSAGHKTQANKLQELILSGMINESQTLQQHANPRTADRLQAQIIADMINQQVAARTGPALGSSYLHLQNLQGLNAATQLSLLGLPAASHSLLATPVSNPLTAVSNAQMESITAPFVRSGGMLENTALATSADGQLAEITSAPYPRTSTASSADQQGSRSEAPGHGHKVVSDATDTKTSTDVKMNRKNNELPPQFHAPVIARPRGFMGRFKPQLYKSLLENFGFEYVMHFNEEHTKTSEAIELKEEYLDSKNELSEEPLKHVESNGDLEIETNESSANREMDKAFHDNKDEFDEETSDDKKEVELTELSRQQCKTCHKHFSNLWVLKNHEEEVHNLLVSSETIESFGQRFKEEWEKNLPKLLEQELGSVVQPPSDSATAAAAPQAAEKLSTEDVQQSKQPAAQPQLPCHLEVPQLLPFLGMNCLPMHLSMNFMNLGLQNSLISSMMMPNMDLSQSFLSHIPSSSLMDSSLAMSSQQQFHMNAAAAAAAVAAAQKRVRTRISDDQLKVLRQYFDINNSPSEEQVNKMSEQTGLPQKVIKHWFRNTLFKERQRNKDSPYNFNNPPCTSFDLGEYDRTGKIPEIKVEIDEDFDRDATPAPDVKKETPPPQEECTEDKNECDTELVKNNSLKMDLTPKVELYHEERKDQEHYSNTSSPSISSIPSTPALSAPTTPTPTPGNIMGAGHPLAYPLDSFATNMSRLESATFHNMGKRANRTRFTDYQIKQLQDYFEQNAYPKDDELEHLSKVLGLSARVIVVWFQNARQKARKIYENQPANEAMKDVPSSYQRTSGQNYQCKRCNSTFQRYYELNKHHKYCCVVESNNNSLVPSMTENDSNYSYSNDDSFLSDYQITPVSSNKNRDTQNPPYPPKQHSVSNTTTCVIPTASTSPASSSSFFVPSFKCEKCSLTFTRFDTWQEHQRAHSIAPAMFTPFTTSPAFRMLENLAYHENDQAVVTTAALPTPPSSSLQSVVSTPNTAPSHEPLAMTLTPTSSLSLSPSSKRKTDSEDDSGEQPKDKRLRTTILPEQLDYLHQQYQVDCNPSRKQLEHIANTINLKKRVVQVWFQNTRARERKGHYRAHQQLINKRCPYCRALFRAKSALESHLATKHPEQVSQGDMNIDLIPDVSLEPHSDQVYASLPSYFSHLSSPLSSLHMATDMKFSVPGSVPALPNYMGLMSSSSGIGLPFPGSTVDMNNASFEDPFFKKYMKDLTKAVSTRQGHSLLHPSSDLVTPEAPSIHSPVKAYAQATPTDFSTPLRPLDAHRSKSLAPPTAFSSNDDAPLDLSKPIKATETLPNHQTSHASQSANQDYSGRSSEREILQRQTHLDDSFSETQSEMADLEYTNDVGNSPPSPSHMSSSFLLNAGSGGSISKRYRTQMSAVQVRVMKHLFQDYKTPTMVECEFLGQEIGLPKRVVQVWFQNARAKEKKAKMVAGKSLSPEADLMKPPEDCQLCRCRYTHKVTLQDHIFTKAHIDKIKAFLNSQADLDHDLSSPSFPGVLQAQNEADQAGRRWDSSVSSLQNVQLQSSQAGPAAISYPHSQGHTRVVGNEQTDRLAVAASLGSDLMHDKADVVKARWEHMNKTQQQTDYQGLERLQHQGVVRGSGPRSPLRGERSQKSHGKESPKKEKKIEDTVSRNEQKHNQAVLEMAMNAQMFSALGGYMPGLDPAYLPYVYSGFPGYFPGMGLPLLQPGLVPEHVVPYDPLVFGTPLVLLQIPSTAIKSVSEKVKEAGSVLAQYTQDCHVLADLHNMVSTSDLTAAAEATLDVGFICKKCQMVYPAKESCIAHQRSICVTSTSSLPKGFEPIMKLEQIQYECRACLDRFSTILEFKVHCQQDSHKQKLMKFKVKEAARREAAESPSSSAPYVPSTGKVRSTPSPYTPKLQTAPPLFNNNSISHNNNQVASPGVAHGMKLPLLPSPAHQYNKVSPPIPAAFTDKHVAAFNQIPDIHKVKTE